MVTVHLGINSSLGGGGGGGGVNDLDQKACDKNYNLPKLQVCNILPIQ